jgi:hypothetical protein
VYNNKEKVRNFYVAKSKKITEVQEVSNYKNSKLSDTTLLALRDRLPDKNHLSLYSGISKLRYAIPLIPRRIHSGIVNLAGGISKLFSYQESIPTSQKIAVYQQNLLRTFANGLMLFGLFIFLGASGFVYYKTAINPNIGAVAGVREETTANNLGAYEQWIFDSTGYVLSKEDDEDKDGLTNGEEFLIGSNPILDKTCGKDKNDAQEVIALQNPATCKPVNFENSEELKSFQTLLNTDNLKQLQKTNLESTPPVQTNISEIDTIKETFQVQDLKDLNTLKISPDELTLQQELNTKRKGYIDLVTKVDQYMEQNRSLEPYDRNQPIPVGGAVYVQVAEEYNVPLKYILAVAQRESRFGTDRYTKNGNLTRPGQYENIVSMGLDDSNNNMSFGGWEASIESFGKWYRRFDDAGVSNCNKWKIYNPNGDYCKHIEETANGIEYFIK